MSHVFSGHNVLYPVTLRGPVRYRGRSYTLECWSMEPTDAASAFRAFSKVDHPDQRMLADQPKLVEYKAFSPE